MSDHDEHAEFFQAIERGEREAVARLIAAHPALVSAHSSTGVSASLYSLYYGEPEIAALLADAGATMTVFEEAALGRAESLGALLAAHPAQVNAFAADGFTPLGLAAFFGQPAAAQVLLDHGADPNLPSANAMRVAPLHSAVAARRLDIAEALLRHGAQVNATQADGFSPLHGAAQNGQVEMIALLLAHGADPHARTTGGQTPLDIAKAEGQEAAVAMLAALPD